MLSVGPPQFTASTRFAVGHRLLLLTASASVSNGATTVPLTNPAVGYILLSLAAVVVRVARTVRGSSAGRRPSPLMTALAGLLTGRPRLGRALLRAALDDFVQHVPL